MCCYHPIEVTDKRTKITRLVPCGKCIGCLEDYQNDWKIRISEEFKDFGGVGVFFTLTYSPETASDTGLHDEFCIDTPFGIAHDQHRVLSVNMRDVQSWLKRCRERMYLALGYRKHFSYFICSEYGPNTLRPHMHGVFIGLSLDDFNKYFFADWNSQKIHKRIRKGKKYIKTLVDNKYYRGNVDVSAVRASGAVGNYVSKYCSKGFFENPRVKRGYVNKCSRLISKGIGNGYVDRMKDYHLIGWKEAVYQNRSCDFPYTKSDRESEYWKMLENCDEKHSSMPFSFKTGVLHHHGYKLALDFKNNSFVRSFNKVTVFDFYYLRKDGLLGRCLVKPFWIKVDTLYDEDVCCLPPELDFIRKIYAHQNITYLDEVKNKIFKYRLPRYYYEKFFPKNSSIRKGLKDYVQLESIRRDIAKLNQIRSERNLSSDEEAYHAMVLQKISDTSRRESKAIERLSRFYQFSVL